MIKLAFSTIEPMVPYLPLMDEDDTVAINAVIKDLYPITRILSCTNIEHRHRLTTIVFEFDGTMPQWSANIIGCCDDFVDEIKGILKSKGIESLEKG